MSKLLKNFVSFKNNLTQIKNKGTLGILSLIVIIFLDIFVLSVLFTGLSDHTNQLISPRQYAPLTCRDVFIEQNWTPENRIDLLQNLILTDYYDPQHTQDLDINIMHPKCQEFFNTIEQIEAVPDLTDIFIQRLSLQKESELMNIRVGGRKSVTDNTLLTDIAQENDSNLHPIISATNKAETEKLEILMSELTGIDKQINNNPKIIALFQIITSWNNTKRQDFINDIKSFEQWYKYKEFGWQMLFLIPLFIVFYLWNKRSLKKDNGLQVLISSHLLVIIAIPVFCKVINLVLELIPKHFLEQLFQVLSSLHLIAVWHYFLILLSVLIAILLIYIIQHKVFNKKRLQEKRLSNSACIECNKKIPDNVKFCPFCGTQQVEICPECKAETYISGDFCTNCGVKRKNIKTKV